MIKQLFFGMCLLLASFMSYGQTVSLVGQQFNNWNDDLDLVSVDGIVYTRNNVALVAGEIKFRENHGWANSWGATSFPVGVGLNVNVNIIVTTPGTYNIIFNKLTGVYAFVLTAYPRVSLVGQNIGTPWQTDIFLNTTDGINYTYNGCNVPVGEFKFRLEAGWIVSWGQGNNLFPIGLAALGGVNINATVAGTYDISFNVSTGAYIFTQTLAVSDSTKRQVVLNTLVKDDLKFSEQVRSVEVYSMEGKLFHTYQNVNTIHLSDLQNGHYILKIQTRNYETFTQRIMKN